MQKTQTLLSVRNIEKAFGLNRVLKGINLELSAGEVLSLIGGNGAGHWVAIMETWDKLYRCMDPLDDSGHLTSLNDHESVAYRMRCVYWAD